MKFEGTQVNIPIKGIMRASTDNLCADGAMNEVIGMEYKDGSWLPYKEKATLDNHGWIPGAGSTDASRIYVHKLSDNTTEDLFIFDVFYGGDYENKVPVLYYYGYPDESSSDSSDSSDSGEPEKVRIEIAPYVRDVSFVGNMLCVATDSGIRYFLWKDGKYTEQTTTPLPKVSLRVDSGLYDKTNTNRVGMRYVTRASARSDSAAHTMSSESREESIAGGLSAVLGAVRDEGGLTGYFLACYAFRHKNGTLTLASAPVLLGRPMQTLGGESTGYREKNLMGQGFANVDSFDTRHNSSTVSLKRFVKDGPSPAAQGTTNDYAVFELPPPPEMLWREDGTRIKEGTRFVEQHTSLVSGEGTYCTTIDGNDEIPYPSGQAPSQTLTYECLLGISKAQNYDDMRGEPTELLNPPVYSNEEVIKYSEVGDLAYYVKNYLWHNQDFTSPIFSTNHPYIPRLACSMIHMNLHRLMENVEGAYCHKYIFSSYASANKLQFKIENVQDLEDSDIESLCIFISHEITPFNLEASSFDSKVYNSTENDRIEIKTIQTASLWDESYWADYHMYVNYFQAKYRTEKEIITDLEDTKSFYLVKEIPKLDIANSTDWETIDLKGMLGENLLTRETLPSTAFDWKKTIPNHIESYNYRLHEYDYIQNFFNGYSLSDFKHNGGDGQIQGSNYNDSGKTYKWEIKVNIKDNWGDTTVVNFDDTAVDTLVKSLTPYISYPSTYADSMTINVYEYGTSNVVYSKEFAMKHNISLGLSYYIDPELKPIVESVVSGGTVPESLPSFEEKDNERTYPNGMKVADSAFPSFFPANFTYRLGSEKIIGLGRMTVPVSQDNRGANKLVVFCTDGIYTMDVTTDGTGAYTSISFADGEVCTNRNSICEIGGAIVFASAKGLMMITGEGVKEFLPALNGKIRFKPAEAEDPYTKSGNAIYKKMITTDSIVKLDEKISYEDFLTFLNKEGTFVAYIAEKNKLLVFNNGKNIDDHEHSYCYLIDIPTRNTTKLSTRFFAVDNNNIGKRFWSAERASKSGRIQATYSNVFEYYSQEANLDCLIASRPIKIQQDDKNSYRLVVSGYFEGAANQWAELVVLGSLDADHWKVIGLKEKKLEGGFHNIGCVTDRDTWKYLMFIFAGQLSTESHIDYIDVTVEGRYNNKKR